MPASRIIIQTGDFSRKILAHRRLPAILALIALAIMLPALKLGLIADDLPQRAVELRPAQLPARMAETGNPADSGKFSTVLFDLFGLNRNPQTVALMKNYGALPWWTPDDLRCSLCRPAAAFTHWMDYRLFPDSPALMHAHNAAWFAAVVFAVAIVYRKLMGAGWAAGLAAVLFLLDPNTYFPAAYVANRGYFLALFFRLPCLYQHHQWRSQKSPFACVGSALCLALSLLSEESGASMFAFILAYAIVLESGTVPSRARTILPAVLVITAWWILYRLSGYGLDHVALYIDPVREPLQFVRALVPRDMILLASQLVGVPPEIFSVVKPAWFPAIVAFCGILVAAALAIFLPWLRQDKMVAFWLVATILAAIPEAVLVPLSKNCGYIAIGAFGLIASFIAAVMTRPKPFPERRTYRLVAQAACVLLVLAHGPGAIAERIAVVKAGAIGFAWASRVPPARQNIENENVIVINHPIPLESAYVPAYDAYFHQPLPKSLRVLAPACTGFEIQRTDDKTIVIESRDSNIFSCDNLGLVHLAYALSDASRLVNSQPHYRKGGRYKLKGLTVEILELNPSDLPSRVAFHFDEPLDSPDFLWLWFNWQTDSMQPFKVPAIGQSLTVPGPGKETKNPGNAARSGVFHCEVTGGKGHPFAQFSFGAGPSSRTSSPPLITSFCEIHH